MENLEKEKEKEKEEPVHQNVVENNNMTESNVILSESDIEIKRQENLVKEYYIHLQKGFTTNRPEDQLGLHKILIKNFPRKDIRGDSS